MTHFYFINFTSLMYSDRWKWMISVSVSRMLATKCLGENFQMLLTVLAIFVIDIFSFKDSIGIMKKSNIFSNGQRKLRVGEKRYFFWYYKLLDVKFLFRVSVGHKDPNDVTNIYRCLQKIDTFPEISRNLEKIIILYLVCTELAKEIRKILSVR